jgi:upstream activation factor subunit UAF30
MRTGFQSAVRPSRALADVLGSGRPTTRGQITKGLWRYIKRHRLQDDRDRRMIHLDRKLGRLFSHRARRARRSVDMFEMTKLLQRHILMPSSRRRRDE